jgi:putative SOS response-associated peptidase YedK
MENKRIQSPIQNHFLSVQLFFSGPARARGGEKTDHRDVIWKLAAWGLAAFCVDDGADTIDTTAARMENSSLKGRIQCSERSVKLLMDQYFEEVSVIPRGEFEVGQTTKMRLRRLPSQRGTREMYLALHRF